MIPPRTLLRVWKSLHPSSASNWSSTGPSALTFPADGELAGKCLISSHSKASGYDGVGLRLIIDLDPTGAVRGNQVYEVDASGARTIADSVRTVKDKTLKLTWLKEEGGGDRYNVQGNGAITMKFAESGTLPFPLDQGATLLPPIAANFQWFLPMWNWTSDPAKGYPNVVFSPGVVQATDGHKLAMIHSDMPIGESFAVMGKHLELAKSLGKMDKEVVKWSRFETHLLIQGENWHLAIPVKTGKHADFPQTTELMAPLQTPAWFGAIRTKEVIKFLKLARKAAQDLIGKHTDPIVILLPAEAGLTLRYTVASDGERIIVPTPDAVFGSRDGGDGGVGAVGVNPSYLISAITFTGDPEPQLTFAVSSSGDKPTTPIMFEGGDPARQTLVMPVSLDTEPISLEDLLKRRGAAGKVA